MFAKKTRPEDDSPQTRQPVGGKQDGPAEKQPQPSRSSVAAAMLTDGNRSAPATIGESLMLAGTLSGLEDVYIAGKVEGAIELQDADLTIGPSGNVNADIKARNVTVSGQVTGNVFAERIEIRKTGSLEGDVKTRRIVVEDGAVFQGSIDVLKREPETGTAPKTRPLFVQQESSAGA